MCCSNFFTRALSLCLLAMLLVACGGGGGGELTPAPAVPEEGNVLRLTVDAGPPGTGYNVNRLYADVTICAPGSVHQCQTIDHVLVDTGSSGLRLLSSVLSPVLNLSRLPAASGLPLLNCVQFVDNTFAWGPVVSADIVLGGKRAASVPIQVIADPTIGSPAPGCSVGGSALTTAATLGANGILGIGLFQEDCGAGCAVVVNNGFYYTCSTDSCLSTVGATASLAQQVKNPVPLFSTDNNGVLVDLPATNLTGAAELRGSLIFGVGTQSNNQLASATRTVLTTDSVGHFTTRLGAQRLTGSFIDSGSNGLFFDSATIPKCGPNGAGFYCPTPRANVLATLVGANGATSPVLTFPIDSAAELFAGGANHALPTLGGDIGNAQIFDWGLPFFFGRRVLFGIEGQASTLGPGPFYAF